MRLVVEIEMDGRENWEVRHALEDVARRVGEWRNATDTHDGWHRVLDERCDPIGRLLIDTFEDVR